eukprot:jgi/Picsp_1/1233/NSC_04714-R1_meiotic recombination protein spo11-2
MEWEDTPVDADARNVDGAARVHQAEGDDVARQQEEALLDSAAPKEEVIWRIEQCTYWLLKTIKEGRSPKISFPEMRGMAKRPECSLKDKGSRFARLWSVLNAAHEMLSHGTTCTQRDLYYSLKSGMPTLHGMQLATAIEDAVQLLRVPRFQLGIACSSKGLVSGPLLISKRGQGGSGREDKKVSCLARCYPQGFSITGNMKDILNMKFECHATHIVIVEKDTVFQRLVAHSAEGEGMLRGVLLVTAKGFPDVATRMFVWRIHQTHPHIPIVGVVDWNPSGASIMSLYRYGSDRMVESSSCALSDIGWLGIRQSTIREIGHGLFQKMSDRDAKVAGGLVKKLKGKNNIAWADEVECMVISGVKVDIEQLYSSCGFSGLCTIITRMLLEKKWV